MNVSSFFYCFIAIALICNSKRHGRLQILLLAHRNKRWLWQRRAPFRNSSNCWVHRWQTWRNNRFGHLAILLVMALQHVTKFLITMPLRFCWSCWEPSNRYVSEFKGFFSTNVRGGRFTCAFTTIRLPQIICHMQWFIFSCHSCGTLFGWCQICAAIRIRPHRLTKWSWCCQHWPSSYATLMFKFWVRNRHIWLWQTKDRSF